MLNWKLYATFGAVILAVTAFAGIQTLRLANEQQAHAETRLQFTDKLLQAEADARNREHQIAQEFEVIQQLESERAKREKDNYERIIASLRNDTLRLSIPARCHAVETGGGASTPSASQPTARAELDPAAAEFLVALTREGDEAIAERNECIQRYNTIRKTLK